MHNYLDASSAQSDFYFHNFKQYKIKIVIDIIEIRSTFVQECKVLNAYKNTSRGQKSTPRTGGHGFAPGPRQTNSTSCSPINTRICGGPRVIIRCLG